jgi:hypothetical protein
MNVSKIVEIAQQSELARAVFKTLSEMEKARPTTDLGRLKARITDKTGKVVNQRELLDVFKALQQTGLGKLILSRDIAKAPHRFEWMFNNIEVGRAGCVDGTAVQAHVPQGKPGASASVPLGQGGAPAGAIVLSYPIRGQLFSFQLPADLSKGEAAELCAFINRFGR